MPDTFTPGDGSNWWPASVRWVIVDAGVVVSTYSLPEGTSPPATGAQVAVRSDTLNVGDKYGV